MIFHLSICTGHVDLNVRSAPLPALRIILDTCFEIKGSI